MRIVWIAAEAVPFVKVGGLADVVGSLPRVLADRGHEVTVILPGYARIDAPTTHTVSFDYAGSSHQAPVGELRDGQVRLLFPRVAGFEGPQIYAGWQDGERFLRFSAAAAALAEADVVHVHDWHAAVVPILAAQGRVRCGATILTIHNVAYQGQLDADWFFAQTGLPRSLLTGEGLEFYGKVNLLKGGIVFADAVTTVSPTYAEEIRTPEFGAGLDGVFRRHSGKLSGILNGIDVDYWNPAADPLIPAPFSAADPGGKALCCRALREELGLEGRILGCVSRLVEQKGIDLLLASLPDIAAAGCSVAILGTGDPQLEARCTIAAGEMPGRVSFSPAFDEALAHRIYAGSEAFLLPSRFEPCGLTQMISQRYGTPPIAHAVGGLRDTISDGITGFLFDAADAASLAAAVRRFAAHRDLAAVRHAAMTADFSWSASAGCYEELYRRLARR